MFSARTVARAPFCVAACLIVILSLYFLPVIGVLGLTLGAVLCVQMDCEPETPAWRACYAVQPMSPGISRQFNPRSAIRHSCTAGLSLSPMNSSVCRRRVLSLVGRSGYPRFFVIFSSLPSDMPRLIPQIRRQPFPSRSFPIHCLLIRLFCSTMIDDNGLNGSVVRYYPGTWRGCLRKTSKCSRQQPQAMRNFVDRLSLKINARVS
jgi:hypothetical protein